MSTHMERVDEAFRALDKLDIVPAHNVLVVRGILRDLDHQAYDRGYDAGYDNGYDNGYGQDYD